MEEDEAEAWIFTKINMPPWVFSYFLYCANVNKSPKLSHLSRPFETFKIFDLS